MSYICTFHFRGRPVYVEKPCMVCTEYPSIIPSHVKKHQLAKGVQLTMDMCLTPFVEIREYDREA
jgi:hypothetical protein